MKFTAIGECLLEFSQVNQTNYSLSFAGDTFNTAYYIANLGGIETYFATAVGNDNKSRDFLRFALNNHINTDLVLSIKDKLMGAYFIENDKKGERSFQYYRNDSAARNMFHTFKHKDFESMLSSEIIYLSGITLAICDESAKQKLYQLLVQAKQRGVKIFFDNNYRPRLWQHIEQAQRTLLEFHKLCDLVFVTFDDERLLFGDKDITITIERYLAAGIQTVVIKDGANPCHIIENKKHYTFPTKAIESVIDTTGAGDSFNAGFIHARLANKTLAEQVACAQQIAEQVIQYQGAIIDLKQCVALPV